MATLVSHIQDLALAIRDKLNLMNNALRPAAITVVVDGGGVIVTDGIKLDVEVPFDCAITGWTILADQLGSATFDLWKTDYAHAPPGVANSIVGNHKPILDSSIKAQSVDISDWIIAVQSGDVIRISVSNVSIVTRLTLILQVVRA